MTKQIARQYNKAEVVAVRGRMGGWEANSP